jgi:hypothetical protein
MKISKYNSNYFLFEKILKTLQKDDNILFIQYNYLNLLYEFSHYIKKLNINIYSVVLNKANFEKTIEDIKDEELESNINIFNNLNIENNYIDQQLLIEIIDRIIIFNVYSITYLKEILSNLINIKQLNIQKNINIHIYCSISNENNKKFNFKNMIRNNIKKYINNEIGEILSLTDILTTIKEFNFNIKKMSIYNKNNYVIYGNNNQYEIII